MFPRQTKSRRTRPASRATRHHGLDVRRALLFLTLLLAACGDDGRPTSAGAPPYTSPSTTAPPSSAPRPTAPPPAASGEPAPLEPARCPAEVEANCTAHTGRVLTIESVDRDGDGDLHVIATGGSITAPGITAFDVSRALRPARDPQPGDRVTGAGPVYRGSFGQRQIEVTTFRVARVGS